MNRWLVAGLFGLLFGLGAREVRKFENLAAQDIRSKLTGENVKVDVKTELNGIIGGALGDLKKVTIRASDFSTPGLPLFTEPERSKKGIVRELNLFLDRFQLGGLAIDHLEASIPDCRFDYSLAMRKKEIRLSKSGIGTGYVRVKERDLERFILLKFKEIKRVSVVIRDHKVFVEGYSEFLIIKTDFLVIASIEPVDGTKLALADAYILFGGMKAPPEAAKALLDTLNPVVDLSKDLGLLDAIKVKRIKLTNGLLEAWGETRIPEKPRAESP